MALDPTQKALAKEYKLPDSAYWMCHGSPIITHKYLEEIARQKNVKIESLEVITCSVPDNYAVVKCTASSDKMSVITIGEASPKNNKNSYPFAMAEKRAVGRAILKLAGLHAHFYEDKFSAKDAADRTGEDPKNKQSKESLNKEILEASKKFSDNGKANVNAGNADNKVGRSKSATSSSLLPGWEKKSVAEQVQVFSSELDQAVNLDTINLIGTKYNSWIQGLPTKHKNEVLSMGKNKKKEIAPND